jgi:hypothetical protein
MNPKPYLTTLLILIAVLLSCFSVTAQNSSTEIQVERRGNKYIYTKNNKELSFSELVYETKEIREAQQLVRKAYDKRAAGLGFAFAGGFCVGFALGDVIVKSMNSNDIETKVVLPLFLGGAGLIIGAYCFEISAKKNAKDGVAIYNNTIKQNSKKYLDLGFSSTGISLNLKF